MPTNPHPTPTIRHLPTMSITTITLCLIMNIQPALQLMPTSTQQHPRMDTINLLTPTSTKSPRMGQPPANISLQQNLVLCTMSPFGNGSAQFITGVFNTSAVILDDFSSFSRYECKKDRRKRSILTLLKLLVGKEKKEKKKKCDSVPVRHCPTVAKVRPVVKCEHH